jgi:peptidoglycan-N-acetylglucosamine deacetylase
MVIVKPTTYITTSWDDGHPLDLRVAELLTKHGLRGTFYVPMTAENGTMTAAQIRELGRAFEIGAHTLNHTVLTSATEQQAWQEIVGSKSWLENNSGLPCVMFCPPKGKYSDRHLTMVRKAGYLGVRTVELLSLDFPRPKSGIALLPTTIQAHPHDLLALARNVIKRAAFDNLWQFVAYGRSTDWPTLARSLLRHAIKCGGVFHLWGHSWELQQTSQWQRLEEVIRFMGELTSQAQALTNGEVCRMTLSRIASVEKAVRGGQPDRKSVV